MRPVSRPALTRSTRWGIMDRAHTPIGTPILSSSRGRELGVGTIAHLAGDIGYVDVRELPNARLTDAAVASALEDLGETPALILDLRCAHVGDPSTLAVLSSYLFDTEPVHLENVYIDSSHAPPRPAPRVATTRYLDRDVYILTGPETAPAASELARRLQRMGRALVVGETPRAFADRAPVTPDLPCPARQALHVAHGTASKRLHGSLASAQGTPVPLAS